MAEALNVSHATIERECEFARASLGREPGSRDDAERHEGGSA
jgi:hypothetical protein